MHKRSKLLLVALVAALMLTATAGTASALRSINVAPGGAITATAAGLIFTGSEGEDQLQSNVTLEGSLERSIAKRAGAAFGSISRGRTERCAVRRPAGATCVATPGPLAGEPAWKIIYNSILGTLPRITGVLFTVEKATFLLRITFIGIRIECLYRGDVPLLAAIGANGEVGTIRLLRNKIPLLIDLNGSGLCPAEGELSGTFTIAPAQRITLV